MKTRRGGKSTPILAMGVLASLIAFLTVLAISHHETLSYRPISLRPLSERVSAFLATWNEDTAPEAEFTFRGRSILPRAAELYASHPSLRKWTTDDSLFFRDLHIYSGNCSENIARALTPRARAPERAKALEWERSLCGARPPFSLDEILSPPHMHPSGLSYSLSSILEGLVTDRTHVASHLHVDELSTNETEQTPQKFDFFFQRLNQEERRELLKGASFILSDSIWMRFTKAGESGYRVYARQDFEIKAQEPPWNLIVNPRLRATHCALLTDAVCWNPFSEAPILKGSLSNLPLKAALFSSVFFSVWLLLVSIFQRRSRLRIQREQAFIFKMLSHELRTPLATSLLWVDELRDTYDALPESAQRAWSEIASGLSQIKRHLDQGLRQIAVQSGMEPFNLQKKSLDAVIEKCVTCFPMVECFPTCHPERGSFPAPCLNEMPRERLLTDWSRNVTVEPFWFEVGLTNILKNAVNHGKAPFLLFCTETHGRIGIHVQDHGTLLKRNLRRISREFVKGPTSTGQGLGLSIVRDKIAEMDGKMVVRFHPTRFSLYVREAR